MCPIINILGYDFSLFVICCGIGVILSVFLISNLLIKKITFRKYKNIILLSFLGMLLGAKIFSIISYSIYYITTYQKFLIVDIIYNSGMVFYGGLLGYILSLKILCNIKQYNFSDISSEVALSIPLFHSFGRLGCFFNGCCYGKLYNGILSIPYRTGASNIWEQRFPTQIAEMIFEISMFIFLYSIYKSKYLKDNLINIYLWLYSIFRFILEFFRGDAIRGVVLGLSFSQIISCTIFLVITIKYIKTISKKDMK